MDRDHKFRIGLTAEEQFEVPLLSEMETTEGEGTVTVSLAWLGVSGTGPSTEEAVQSMLGSLNEVLGSPDSPGPAFDKFAAYVREHGEPIAAEQLAAEKAERDKQLQEFREVSKQIQPVTPDELPTETAGEVPTLVDFWAEWCGPCRAAAPVLAELAERWEGRIRIRKLDVDAHEGISQELKIQGIPTMILFRGGEEIHRIVGFGGKEHLEAELEPYLA